MGVIRTNRLVMVTKISGNSIFIIPFDDPTNSKPYGADTLQAHNHLIVKFFFNRLVIAIKFLDPVMVRAWYT